MIDQLLYPVCVHALILQQIEDDSGVEHARACSHRKTIDGGEAHGIGNAAAPIDGAHAGAVAEMSNDELGVGAIRRHARQGRNNIFIGKAVEAIAPYALRREFTRQRVLLSDRRLGSVEGGIKAGDLRHFGRDGGDRTDRGDIVRLVQRRKRNKRRKVGHDMVIDQHRLGIAEPAMDDAVADAREARLTAEVSGKPLVDCRDGAVMALG